MARPARVPAYSLHKPSGRAVVKVKGRSIYLGPYGSDESREAYARVVADLAAYRNPERPISPGAPVIPSSRSVTVAEVVEQYQAHAAGYYRKNGEPTSEVSLVHDAFAFVSRLYGTTPAAAFDVVALRRVRESMVDAGLARPTVNRAIGRIVRGFQWAVTEKLYPGFALAELRALPGLRRGRTVAPEPEPIAPVEDAVIEATLEHLVEPYATMVRLQRSTGMRPGEVCALRPGDVDTTGDVWVYRPSGHKTEHHGRVREVFIGPRSQALLRPFLDRPADEFCFRAERGSRVPRRLRRFRRDTYATAIRRACWRAAPMPDGLNDREQAAWKRRHWWGPNRLRHTFATEVRREHGLEAAQVILGHSNADVTQVYAERDHAKGESVVRLIG